VRLSRQATVLVGLAAVCVAVAYGISVLGAEHPPRSTLEMAPLGTTMIAHVEVPALLRSPIWAAFAGEDEGMSRIERVCGSNPLESLRTADVYVVGTDESPLAQLGFLARGDLDHERLVACVGDVVEGDGGGVHEVTLEGVRAIASDHGDGRAAFLGRDGIVGGGETLVRELIHLDHGSARPMDDPALARLWAIVIGRRQVVAALHVPDRWRGAIARYLAELPALRPVERAAAVAIGANLDHGIGLTVALACERAADAEELAASLRFTIAEQLEDAMVALSPLGAALRRLEIEPQDRDVIVTLDLTERQLELVVSLIRETLEARRERETQPRELTPPPPEPGEPLAPDEILRPTPHDDRPVEPGEE
jgi:hypothetical protein